MERTYPAADYSEPSSVEDELIPRPRPSGSYERALAAAYHARAEGVHLASVAEKKRLWIRKAIINTLFIASWCVSLALFDIL